mmetsp:Transcript_66443/g.210284  ORF Transcript_66443/g.210284 Transcript_66443/m.210284 type:complete len:414 (-) Transcript_66443:155-1396(-)
MLNLDGVSGAGMIVGIGVASDISRLELKRVLKPSLLALALTYGMSLPFDAAMARLRPGPPHSTTAHFWYMHSITCALLCVYIIDSRGQRTWGRLAAIAVAIAAIMFVALPIYAHLDYARVASLEPDELGKECFTSAWMVAQKGWEPVGIRVFTGVPGILGGYLLSPSVMKWTWRARSRLWMRAACLAFLAWKVYRATFFAGGVDLRDGATAEAVQLRGQLLAHAGSPVSSVSQYLATASREAMGLVMMLASIIAQLVVAPAGRLPLLTWLGENPHFPYMFHPHLLWALEPAVFGALRRAKEAGMDVTFFLVLVPFTYQVACALPALLLDESNPGRQRVVLLYRGLREWRPFRRIRHLATYQGATSKVGCFDAGAATVRIGKWLRRPGAPWRMAVLLVSVVFLLVLSELMLTAA